MERVTSAIGVPGERILLRATKFDGAAHWLQPFKVVADDGELLVTTYKARTPVYTSRGEFRSPYDSKVYFWRNRWYNVFQLSRPGCGTSLWYCNVTTPPVFDGQQISYSDLDLDVVVTPDGCVNLKDEDEFKTHQVKYDYPAAIIQQAREAAEELMEMGRARAFPFDQR